MEKNETDGSAIEWFELVSVLPPPPPPSPELIFLLDAFNPRGV